MDNLKQPFPYFGSKKKVTAIIWQGLGQVDNYVESFLGSASILLNNPSPAKIETVNDKDCHLSNFFRAIKSDPITVIKYADCPVSEADLHARQKYIIEQTHSEFIRRIQQDPDFSNAKIAGYYLYGMCASIGNNWLLDKNMNSLPYLSSAGVGINALKFDIKKQLTKLQERLKRVRICCGDWKRVLTPSITYNNRGLTEKSITGIVLDPPYLSSGRDKVYKEEDNIYNEVCQWAIENGENKKLRIVVCGYEGFEFPNDWQVYEWKTGGGMANLGNNRGKANAQKERIYFSPHCLKIKE